MHFKIRLIYVRSDHLGAFNIVQLMTQVKLYHVCVSIRKRMLLCCSLLYYSDQDRVLSFINIQLCRRR